MKKTKWVIFGLIGLELFGFPKEFLDEKSFLYFFSTVKLELLEERL